MKISVFFLLLLFAMPAFASDEAVVIRRGDNPPVGVPYSYYEDYSDADQRGLKIYGETETETKSRQSLAVKPAPEVKKEEKQEAVKAGEPQIAIMDNKEYVVIERGQKPPGPGVIFIYKEDFDCKGGH